MTFKTIYLIVINLISFILMGYDKHQAKNNNWRISEYTLFCLSFIGGSLGTLIGMYTFHHKTKKTSFKLGIPLLLLLNILIFKKVVI